MEYNRLKKQADFQRLFQKGKRAFSPALSVIYRPCEKMTMGISVGKKHGKSNGNPSGTANAANAADRNTGECGMA